MHARLSSFSRTLPIAGLTAVLALLPQISQAQDPPPGDSRLGRIQGTVTIQPAGLDSWGQAENNIPVNPGDRLVADPGSGGQAELQAGFARVYFGRGADITLTSFGPQGVEFGIASGSADFHTDALPPGQNFYVSTPNGGVSLHRGGFRVDVFPDQQTTVVTNLPNWNPGPIEVNGGGGFATVLTGGQSIQLTGTNPVFAQPLMPGPLDDFQHWAEAIEYQHVNSLSLRYVNPGMIGYAELDGAGEWHPDSPYGPVWYPHVEAGWAPYHNGHWVNRPFYGWVWVANEPWGSAPFHYGRWVTVSGRWGWIPGPREVAPVWSPAQVVFAGGINVGGVGLSVWFPLGPGEPYKPWYPCSPHYIDQINISNIHPAPQVVVHNTYVNIVNTTNVTNVTYVNRTVGVSAMNQADFAAGHSAANVSVHIDVNLVQHVQPAAPAARPPAQPIIIHPVARPAAVAAARPVLINHSGQQITATAHPHPVSVPVKAAPPAPKLPPGRQATGSPTLGGKPTTPAAQAGKPAAPAQAEKPQAHQQPSPAAQSAKPEKPGSPANPHPAAAGEKPQSTPAAKSQPAPAAKTTTTAKPQPNPAAKPATPAAKPATPAANGEKPESDKSKDAKKKQKKADEQKKDQQKPE